MTSDGGSHTRHIVQFVVSKSSGAVQFKDGGW